MNELPAGVVTPLVTFLDESGTRPHAGHLKILVDTQVAAGVHGLLAIGSTGELGSLSADGRRATVRVVVDAAAGRVPVWAGAGGLGTLDTVQAARDCVDAGADAVLALQPLFFDCSDDELYEHFAAIAGAVDVPVIAYNVPVRTPRALSQPLQERLVRDGVIAGIKDSSGDLAAGRLLCRALAGTTAKVYSGGELTLDSALAAGFHGIVPGFANILPGPAVALWEHAGSNDKESLAAQESYLELFGILAAELPGAGFPARAIGAIKCAAAAALGLPVPRSTPPLTAPTAEFAAAVAAVVQRA
ncbi:dihydrodipicolinate synthase family protein [Kribbella sp.]|uniref:dihydrodipicolinate synthase family protein n=1 Tax=Kribbella sp. TaxID=1871183 RepID=UPI002D62141C|nr:dihydrodipicolinate synthase family protein [Kribbella sp.]HZX07811.1 dihydrodipicolinate synthase family protein [Kribbella sp.]